MASDKGYLRSTLVTNLSEAKAANISHRDLLGLSAVKIFEIGTVFQKSEEFRVALAVQTGSAYKAKVDDVLLKEALDVVKQVLGIEPELIYHEQGVAEFSLDQLLAKLSAADYYESFSKVEAKSYRTFSVYPASSRDVAMWVDQEGRQDQIENLLKAEAGPLCVRITHLDTFSKEGRVLRLPVGFSSSGPHLN